MRLKILWLKGRGISIMTLIIDLVYSDYNSGNINELDCYI